MYVVLILVKLMKFIKLYLKSKVPKISDNDATSKYNLLNRSIYIFNQTNHLYVREMNNVLVK